MRTITEFDPLIGPGRSILGHLNFRSFTPHPLLLPWVQCYWVARQPNVPEVGFAENLYPDGGTNINFRFISNDFPQVTFQAFKRLTRLEFREEIHLLGIRFRPGGAFQLLRMDMQGLVGDLYHLDEMEIHMNDSRLHFLRENLSKSTKTQQRINLLDSWLLQKMTKLGLQNGPVQMVLPDLPNSFYSVDDLSLRIGLSRRQLERRFQQEVGMTLVDVKQMQRMKKARQLISLNPVRSLTHIGYELGFYDQSHFIRQFHKINQQSPSEYRHRKRKSQPN